MELLELIKNHRSVRRFKDRPVSDELIKEIISAARHSATSEFIQAYSVIRIRSEETRQRLFDKVTDQKPILNAPVLLMICSDVSRIAKAEEIYGTHAQSHCNSGAQTDDTGESPIEYGHTSQLGGQEVSGVEHSFMDMTEIFLVASVDAAIFAQSITLAAESQGLGCTYIGGMRNNTREVSEALKLPKGVFPIFGMIMGYPRDEDQEGYIEKPRLPMEIIYREEEYPLSEEAQKTYDEKLAAYDLNVKDYYIKRTGGKRNETWSEQMAKFAEKVHRPKLKEEINNQGFKLE